MLSVGIGVNLAFFQAVSGQLLQPLQVKDPRSLVNFHYRGKTFDSSDVPYPVAVYAGAHTDALSAVLVSRVAALSWSSLGDEIVNGEFVSANWFDELGAGPAAGRMFHRGVDDTASAPAVVVLSYRFWQRSFGGRLDLVGSTIRLNGQPTVVAGVTDARFPGLDRSDFWIPIERIAYFQPASAVLNDWATQTVQMYGRLRPGVSLAGAREASRAVMADLAAARPDAVGPGQWLEPYSGDVRFMPPQERQQAWTIVAAVAVLTTIVLMVMCLNLSNLTLARAVARVREMSIRTALGAGRWRVLRHLAVEHLLLAGAGAAGGWLLTLATMSVLATEAVLPPFSEFDWRMLLAAACAAFFAALVVGFAPAWKIGRQDLALAARDGGERSSRGLHAARLRHWLAAGQVAGSCVLVVFAAQMLRGLERAVDTNQGFSLDRLAVLEPPEDSFGAARGAAVSFWNDVRTMVGAQPEVEGVTLANAAPLGDGISSSRFAVAPVWFRVLKVDPDFFATLRIPILSGRAFALGDDEASAVVISRQGALDMYGTLDVLGRGFPKGAAQPTIVGIAGDARLSNVQATDQVELYRPLPVDQTRVMIVRARTDPARLVTPLRDAVRAVDPRVLPAVRLVRDDFDRELRGPRLASALAGLTACLALVLAALGIFGVVSYGVGLRTKEIGVRLALGATTGSVLRLLLRYTLVSGAAGLVVGLAGGWPAGKAFAGSPFYLRPLDPAAYGLVTILLLATGAAPSCRRGARCAATRCRHCATSRTRGAAAWRGPGRPESARTRVKRDDASTLVPWPMTSSSLPTRSRWRASRKAMPTPASCSSRSPTRRRPRSRKCAADTRRKSPSVRFFIAEARSQ